MLIVEHAVYTYGKINFLLKFDIAGESESTKNLQWICENDGVGMSSDGKQFYDLKHGHVMGVSGMKPKFTKFNVRKEVAITTDVSETLDVFNYLEVENCRHVYDMNVFTCSYNGLKEMAEEQNVNIAYFACMKHAYVNVELINYDCTVDNLGEKNIADETMVKALGMKKAKNYIDGRFYEEEDGFSVEEHEYCYYSCSGIVEIGGQLYFGYVYDAYGRDLFMPFGIVKDRYIEDRKARAFIQMLASNCNYESIFGLVKRMMQEYERAENNEKIIVEAYDLAEYLLLDYICL